MRPTWRIAVIILMLYISSRGGRATLKKLYVLNWAISTSEHQIQFRQLLQGKTRPQDVIIRFEPAFARAIDFAVGEGLVFRSNGESLQLTPLGRSIADEILSRMDCLRVEKSFLEGIKGMVLEKDINAILNWEPNP